LIALAQPAIIALLCAIIIPVLRAVRGDHRPLRFYVVLVCLVLGNQFLPQVVGTAMSAMPCVHMQKSEDGSLIKLMAFNLDVKCDNKPASLLLVTTGTVIFAILCGPIYWWVLLRRTTATGYPASEGGEDGAEKKADGAAEEGPAGGGEAAEGRAEDGKDKEKGKDKDKNKGESSDPEPASGGMKTVQEFEDAAGPPAGSGKGLAASGAAGGAAGEDGEEMGGGQEWQHDQESEGKGGEEGPGGEAAGQEEDPAGFLIGNYRDGCRAWEAIVLLRKMALAIATTLAPMSYSPGQHIIIAQAILMFSLIGHFYSMPYKKDILNLVEGMSLMVVNVALILASYVTMDIWSATTLSKQVATVAAGMMLMGWFVVLICLLIWAKWTEMRTR